MGNSDWTVVPPWRPINTPAAALSTGPDKLRKVIAELAVETSPRYKAVDLCTWCNIFVWDVTRQMRCEIPHWVKDGAAADPGQGNELTANGMHKWLKKYGPANGWHPAERLAALDAAARGHVVVVCYNSHSSRPGHIAIVLPEGTIAQAGRENFVGKTIREGFGTLPVEFFVQVRGPHLEGGSNGV